ncbi:MAG TPA: hypothetical protein VG053_07050 [Solirubrobacteraceae bacterium]|nr:hypothetical protein [Solirubrobacteraceae bacterium]
MLIFRRKTNGIIAGILSVGLALTVLGPGVAIACEGITSGEEKVELDQQNPSGVTYLLPNNAGAKEGVYFNNGSAEKVEIKKPKIEGDAVNWSYKELANCEKTFNPGNKVCVFKVELVNAGAAEGILKWPYKFAGGFTGTYEMKFKHK